MVIENESCQHQLPRAEDTVAVLGSGFDLDWTDAEWLAQKKVGYWGDIDTWGLQFLARARRMVPHLEPLLMSSQIMDRYKSLAVVEPVIAAAEPPQGLTTEERQLYQQLVAEDRGRLEQEFLPKDLIHEKVYSWLKSASG